MLVMLRKALELQRDAQVGGSIRDQIAVDKSASCRRSLHLYRLRDHPAKSFNHTLTSPGRKNQSNLTLLDGANMRVGIHFEVICRSFLNVALVCVLSG
jgi:hypothetical protein